MTTPDKRAHPRCAIKLNARFILKDGTEKVGQLKDISLCGLAISTDAITDIGDEIIIYPDGLGRIEGIVSRKHKGTLAIAYTLSETQEQHLSKRINSALSGVPYLRLLENRSADRITLNLVSQARTEPGGKTFACEIIDLSKRGALIHAKQCPAIGTYVRIGSIGGIVRRHTGRGFAIEFGEKVNNGNAHIENLHASRIA